MSQKTVNIGIRLSEQEAARLAEVVESVRSRNPYMDKTKVLRELIGFDATSFATFKDRLNLSGRSLEELPDSEIILALQSTELGQKIMLLFKKLSKLTGQPRQRMEIAIDGLIADIEILLEEQEDGGEGSAGSGADPESILNGPDSSLDMRGVHGQSQN